VGGDPCVDHALGYINPKHQLELSAVETIHMNQSYECHCMDHGIVVRVYVTDSGALKANSFLNHIHEMQQLLRFCETNAHHQNGFAERDIQPISNMAGAMILHASMHWKYGINSSIWPMAVQYACHIYHTTPKNDVSPADIF
jgi:hypothetical protein